MQLKRNFCLPLYMGFALTIQVATAQFLDNPISSAVDELYVDFSFNEFEPQSNTCTKGAEAITSKVTEFGLSPQMGFFVNGAKSFRLDFNVTDAISDVSEFGFENYNRFEITSYDRFGRATILSEFRSTTNGWRRMSFAIPEDAEDIQFSYNFTGVDLEEIIRIGDAVKIDNVVVSASVLPSINMAVVENGCVPEPAPPAQNYLPGIVSFLLEEEPIEEPTIQKITGTFSLPTGVEPVGDVVYEVITEPFEIFTFEGQQYSSTEQLTISEQEPLPAYELFIPPDAGTSKYKIRFKCLEGCENLNVTTEGYWRQSGSVVGEINATAYSGEQSHTVNIQMEDARIFAGNLNFLANLVPAGGEFFSVNLISLSGEDPRFWNIYSTLVGVGAGLQTVPFRIAVPVDDPVPTAGWFLYVNCIICDSRFEHRLQYSTNILTGDPLSVDAGNARLFPVSTPFLFDDLLLTPLATPE